MPREELQAQSDPGSEHKVESNSTTNINLAVQHARTHAGLLASPREQKRVSKFYIFEDLSKDTLSRTEITLALPSEIL